MLACLPCRVFVLACTCSLVTVSPTGAAFAPPALYLVLPDFQALKPLSQSPFHPWVHLLVSLPSLLSLHVALAVRPQLSPQCDPCPGMALLPYCVVDILPILQVPPAPAHQAGGIVSHSAALVFCSYFHDPYQI